MNNNLWLELLNIFCEKFKSLISPITDSIPEATAPEMKRLGSELTSKNTLLEERLFLQPQAYP